jgi:hypothetical protein
MCDKPRMLRDKRLTRNVERPVFEVEKMGAGVRNEGLQTGTKAGGAGGRAAL